MSKDDQSDFDPDDEYEVDEYTDDEYPDGPDDEYEYEYDEYEEEERPPTHLSRAVESVRSGTQRLRGTARRPGSGKSLSDRDTKRAIYMLNDRERLYAFIASAASAIMGVAIYATETSNKHFRLAKGELTPQTMLLVGLAGGALLLATTLIGRRALVGFMVFFAGAAFSTKSFVFALPYWALAFWLLWRSSRIQRQRSSEARAEAAARPRRAGTKSGGSRTSGSSKPRARSDTRAKRPEANKRYTPPRPPPKPKPAPPARRPRKTTTKND